MGWDRMGSDGIGWDRMLAPLEPLVELRARAAATRGAVTRWAVTCGVLELSGNMLAGHELCGYMAGRFRLRRGGLDRRHVGGGERHVVRPPRHERLPLVVQVPPATE